MKNNIYIAFKAIIMRDDKILIIKRSSKEDCFKNQWDIPGGKFNFGENPSDCLKREVFEETNIEIYDDFQPVRVWTFFKDNGRTQVVGITFLCRYKSGKIRISKEHTDFKWINPSEIDAYDIHDGIKEDVRVAMRLKSYLINKQEISGL
jgi:8-oxo-dGTP diphosphatase